MLADATQRYNRRACPRELETISRLIDPTRRVFDQLCALVPTSAVGAAEMIKIAMSRLPAEYSRYEKHMHDIAERLSRGQRDHADLVWLRALEAALVERMPKTNSCKIASLIASAIAGISRPVIVPARRTKSRSRAGTKLSRLTQLETQLEDGLRSNASSLERRSLPHPSVYAALPPWAY
jgi:hypothetical protein